MSCPELFVQNPFLSRFCPGEAHEFDLSRFLGAEIWSRIFLDTLAQMFWSKGGHNEKEAESERERVERERDREREREIEREIERERERERERGDREIDI